MHVILKYARGVGCDINILLYSQTILPRENFRQFHHLHSLAKILSVNFLPCIDDYIGDMATFTGLEKIYSAEYFCKLSLLGLAKFCPAKIFGCTVPFTKHALVISI